MYCYFKVLLNLQYIILDIINIKSNNKYYLYKQFYYANEILFILNNLLHLIKCFYGNCK